MAVVIAALTKIALWLLALIGIRWDAKRDARRDAELMRAKDTIMAERMREEISDDLDTESDLRKRAARAGLVRPRPE